MPALVSLVLAAVAVSAAGRALVLGRASAAVSRRLGGSEAGPRPLGVVVAVVAVVAHALAGPVVAVAAGSAVAVAPRVRARVRHARDVAAADDALPDAVDEVARSLRAGQPPRTAFTAAASGAPPRLAAALDGIAVAVDRGVPLADAVDRWAAACGVDGAPLVAGSIALTGTVGGDHARALAGVADTLRERRALRRELRALSSQARSSAAVIALAPAAFMVVLVLTDGATARFLLATPLGLACLTVGLALEVVGWRWMARITGAVR